jgi:hypothetical protein
MKTQQISRRALAAGLALAPVAGVPAIAGAPISGALARAMERHRAADAIVEAHSGPEDVPAHLVDAETEALWELAITPCANDRELLVKLGYLLAHEKTCTAGGVFYLSNHGSLPIALDLHFNPEA